VAPKCDIRITEARELIQVTTSPPLELAVFERRELVIARLDASIKFPIVPLEIMIAMA
jgi:hypothetical protein